MQVNECKQRIDELKTGIERSRLQKSIPRLGRMTISNSDFAVAEPDAQEQTAKQHIEEACPHSCALHYGLCGNMLVFSMTTHLSMAHRAKLLLSRVCIP